MIDIQNLPSPGPNNAIVWTNDGKEHFGQVWRIDVEEGHIEIIGNEKEIIEFEDINWGVIQDRFDARGLRKRRILKHIATMQQRKIQHLKRKLEQ